MKLLYVGDIYGNPGRTAAAHFIPKIKKEHNIDIVIANGENTTDIRGLSARDAAALLDTGIDLLTLGNHAFGIRDIYPFLDSEVRIIRPANYPPEAPGNGYTIANVDGWKILCINIGGRVYLDPLASPFDTVDRILEREKGNYDFAVMDIHAEASSEKLAMAHYFDGRVAVMFGTHTHVPTADEQILPRSSGYITDLGMCGPQNGIIGTDKDDVIHRFRTLLPTHFHVATGAIACHGAIFELDGTKVKLVQRIKI